MVKGKDERLVHGRVSSFLINFVYPCYCLHCHRSTNVTGQALCEECLALLELVDLQERCPSCFSSDYCVEDCYCLACAKRTPTLDGIASAFDYMGSAKSLIRCLKYSDMPHLSRGIAAYLAVQFSRLGWPWPDVLVPVPVSFFKWIERGYNQSTLLAQHLGKIIGVPVVEALRRRSGDFSQAMLGQETREQLSGQSFFLKRKASLEGKRLMLIDDVITTGTTLVRCAELLLTAMPASVYGLTACYAIRNNKIQQ